MPISSYTLATLIIIIRIRSYIPLRVRRIRSIRKRISLRIIAFSRPLIFPRPLTAKKRSLLLRLRLRL